MPAPTYFIDPKLCEYATPTQKKYIEAINRLKSMRATAREFKVNYTTVHKSIEQTKTKAAIHGYHPETGLVHPVAPGQRLRGASQLYRRGEPEPVLTWVKSTTDHDATEAILREFITSLSKDAKGKSPVLPAPEHSNEDVLCVYPFGDPHFGMRAWAEETGNDFSTEHAERLTCGAIDRLIASAPPSDTGLILPLGDYFHADDSTARTPNSGHLLEVDTRWPKVMQAGLRALIYCVKAAMVKHKHVIIRIVKGNHDIHASFALALALDAYFSNQPDRVTVDLSPAPMWYYRFGKVLLGTTHGDQTKIPDMPGIMAFDRASDWGETRYRYWYLGHVHHQTAKEFPGCIVEQFRTLAARDAWHAGKGYRAGRDMCLIVLHKEYGEVERHRCDIAMIEKT
jgi:hypothetical protein